MQEESQDLKPNLILRNGSGLDVMEGKEIKRGQGIFPKVMARFLGR